MGKEQAFPKEYANTTVVCKPALRLQGKAVRARGAQLLSRDKLWVMGDAGPSCRGARPLKFTGIGGVNVGVGGLPLGLPCTPAVLVSGALRGDSGRKRLREDCL